MKKQGFTLVELSIVLVIVSFIIGGITLGTAILKNAKIISVISEVNQYKTALAQFKNQYGALPGDITNATVFWPNCTSAAGDGGVCNGNGDGVIGISGSLRWSSTYNANENLRAWQHLSLAKLIPGNYSGYGAGGTSTGQFDFNTPRSKYPNSGYSFYGDGCYSTYASNYTTFLALSNVLNASFSTNALSIIPIDAYNLDNKIDDGNPKTGNIFARSSDITENCGLASTSNACVNGTNSTYYTTNINPVCMVYFVY